MAPKEYFEKVWRRADIVAALHAYTARTMTNVLDSDELLRAEWALRVSALDLYIHEVVAQNLLAVFEGNRTLATKTHLAKISISNVVGLNSALTPFDKISAFDLGTRAMLSKMTFQSSNQIDDGLCYVFDKKIWDVAAGKMGMSAPAFKRDLDMIAYRRNKIVHEGDLVAVAPRTEQAISPADLKHVREIILAVHGAVEDIM